MNILVNVLIQQTFMEFNILYILHIIHYIWRMSYIMYIYMDNISTFFFSCQVPGHGKSLRRILQHFPWLKWAHTHRPHVVSDCIMYIHLSEGPEWLQSSESTNTLPGPSGQPPGPCRRLFSYLFSKMKIFFLPVFKIVNSEPLQKNTLQMNQT